MSKKTELLSHLTADLAVLNVKFHNLHWNVVGPRFVPVHEALEAFYDLFFEQYDTIAERMRMLGEYAPSSLKSYLEISDIKELANRDYTIKEVLEIVKETLDHLKGLVRDIRVAADEDDDPVTAAMMDDLEGEYDKQLWFVAQQMK